MVAVATLVVVAVTAQPAAAISLTFAQQRPALGFEPFDVRPGDVDGDGVADLVLGEGGTGGVAVARGNGDGTFRAPFTSRPVTWSNGRIGFSELAVGDVNADGRADVAVGTGGWNGVNEVQVLLGRADGTLTAARSFTASAAGPPPHDIAIADLNGDGSGDLVMPLWPGATLPSTMVSVLLSDGNGGFGAPAEYPANTRPTAIAVADFNGDGKRDVVVTNNNASEPDTVSVLPGNGDGTLSAPLSTPLFNDSGPHNMVAADLNGDGRQDVAIAHSSSSISHGWASVLFGNGNGSFQKLPRFAVHGVGTQGPLLATADFNRDGLGDLVVAGLEVSLQKRQPYQFSDDGYDPQNPETTIGARLGNGLFGLPEIYATPSTTRVTAADFNGDGWTDIAAIGEEGSARTRLLTVQLNRTASMPAVALASLTLDAGTVSGDSTSGGTVTLAAPAPPGGTTVEINSTSHCLIQFHGDVGCNWSPAPVTVPAGQTSAHFSFRAAGPSSTTTVTLIAQLRDVTRAARLTITGTNPKRTTTTSVTCIPSTVALGSPTTCTATVTDADNSTTITPSGTVSFGSSGSGTFSAMSCTLAASGGGGSTGCSVTYTPTAKGTHTITASYGGDATNQGSSGSTKVTIPKRR